MEITNLIIQRLIELLTTPFQNPIMFWELGPLILTLFILELYFGRYKNERVGWASTVSNSLVLIFVGSNLLHYLYLENLFIFADLRSILPFFLIAAGLILFTLDFFHMLPQFIAYGISSVLPINLTAAIVIILVHTQIPLDKITFFAGLILFIILLLIIKIIQFLEPNGEESIS